MNTLETQFDRYLAMLQEWNQHFNLTRITCPAEMRSHHLADSLSINPYLHGTRILDVGTGAGLPGIPLAVANPDKHFTLLDSNGKKTRFVTQAVYELKLTNIEVIHLRVEQFNPESKFDSILTRAFSSLQNMIQLCEHLLAPQGLFLAMKGKYPTDELSQLPSGYRLQTAHTLSVPSLAAERHLISIERTHG